MPEFDWLEAPTWVIAVALAIWLMVRSVGWGIQIKQGTAHPEPNTHGNGSASAEWRGETRQVLKQLHKAIAESAALDRQTVDVLREVRDELRAHNTGASDRHRLVEQIYDEVMKRRG